VEPEKSKEDFSGGCCGGESNQQTGTGCNSGTPPRRSRVKLWLFAIVMLAAVGVGAYSLGAKSGAAPATQNCGKDCQTNCCGK